MHMTDSIDGAPLATELSHLFPSGFPRDRLPDSNDGLSFCLRPEGMLALLAFYFASIPLFQCAHRAFHIDPKASWLLAFVALHNLALALFSAVVALGTWPIVYQHYKTYGFYETYCDPHDTLWTGSGLGEWTVLFYLSKYYEFIDTWILLLKGKDPSFLQLYHHAGIVLCMWIGVLSHSSWLKYVTLLNSVIHTLMYTYFFMKTLNPTLEIKAVAKRLTTAQIGQFFTGIFLSFPILFLGERCDTVSSRFGLGCLQVYGYGLVALFTAFAGRKYKPS